MPEQRTYPHGVTCWIDVEQPDLDAAARFYSGLFGWTLTEAMPPDAPGSYLVATLDGKDVAALGPSLGGCITDGLTAGTAIPEKQSALDVMPVLLVATGTTLGMMLVNVPAVFFGGTRFIVAGAALLLFAWLRGEVRPLRRHELARLALVQLLLPTEPPHLMRVAPGWREPECFIIGPRLESSSSSSAAVRPPTEK